MSKVYDRFREKSKEGLSHPPGTAPDIYFLGLSAEVGEVMTEFQRHLWGRKPLNYNDLRSELGDVLWYVYMIGDYHGIDMDEMMEDNLIKRKERYNV